MITNVVLSFDRISKQRPSTRLENCPGFPSNAWQLVFDGLKDFKCIKSREIRNSIDYTVQLRYQFLRILFEVSIVWYDHQRRSRVMFEYYQVWMNDRIHSIRFAKQDLYACYHNHWKNNNAGFFHHLRFDFTSSWRSEEYCYDSDQKHKYSHWKDQPH